MSTNTISVFRADDGLVGGTHLVYGLHVAAALGALLGPASVPGAVFFAAPLVLALTVNYLLRAQAQGTALHSHLGWQIGSAWIALGGLALLGAGAWAIATEHAAGLALWVLGKLLLGGWLAYRGVRGWLALGRGREVIARRRLTRA